MSYLAVSEADELLSGNSAWAALDESGKKQQLAIATLWLNVSYEWIGCIDQEALTDATEQTGFPYTFPVVFVSTAAVDIGASRREWPRVDCCTGGQLYDCDGVALNGIPDAVKWAQINALTSGLTNPLFELAVKSNEGATKRKKVKAGSVLIETEWETESRGEQGQTILPHVDAILSKVATRRGVGTGRQVLFM